MTEYAPGAHLRAMPELLRVGFAWLVAYRAEMVIWILTASMPLIMLALWDAVAAGGDIAGLDRAELARYFAATLVVRQLTGAWIVWELNWDIRNGGLSPKLLRPVNPLWVQALWMLAALPFRIAILVPMLGALLLWRPELWATPSATSFGLFLVSAALAWALAFLVQAIFGMLSFWLDQSMGLWGVWFSVWTVLSGYVAPLAAFPEGWRAVLALLPFRAMLATPVELLGGFLDGQAAYFHVGVQLGWVFVLSVVAAAMWRRGLARYGAFGA